MPGDINLPELKRGWKLGFGDDDEFIDYFFSHYDSDDTRSVVRDDNGCIIAQLHCYQFYDAVCNDNGCYIYGVTTLSEYRGKGIAAEMIKNLLLDLSGGGVAYAVLIAENAVLQRWYEKLGFVKRTPIIEVKGQDDNMNFAMDDISKNQGMYYVFNREIPCVTTKILIPPIRAVR